MKCPVISTVQLPLPPHIFPVEFAGQVWIYLSSWPAHWAQLSWPRSFHILIIRVEGGGGREDSDRSSYFTPVGISV